MNTPTTTYTHIGEDGHGVIGRNMQLSKLWCIIRSIRKEGPDELAFKTTATVCVITIDNEEMWLINGFIRYTSFIYR